MERCCISFGWTTGGSRRTWPGTAKRRCAAGLPGRFTHRSILAWLARKDGISQRQARRLIGDYLAILESGALLGHRVPVGRMGVLLLKKRPSQKARVGINPATGEKMTLAARPEEPVPRMRFSRLLKDRARQSRI